MKLGLTIVKQSNNTAKNTTQYPKTFVLLSWKMPDIIVVILCLAITYLLHLLWRKNDRHSPMHQFIVIARI
jgi:hypothetical protein